MFRVLRDVAKRMAFRALGSTTILDRKMSAIRRAGALTILNLHRVAPADGSAYQPLEPSIFDRLLTFVGERFEIVTFATAADNVGGLPKLILSFDDGYEDFAIHAAPILARHGMRANQNIIPACVESGLPPLNVILQDFIGRASEAELKELTLPGFHIDVDGHRTILGNRVSNFVKNKSMAEQEELSKRILPRILGRSFRPTSMMSLDQVREMAKVHEIGVHSFAHASLAYESDRYLRTDIDRCRTWLNEKLGLPLQIYAVPNGSYRDSQIELLGSAGIRDILLVDEDFSAVDATIHPRFTFDARSSREMAFKALGGLRWPRLRANAQ